MGFWKTLGKIALKAAPIAAAFIPGVGPLASMAIGGATSGLSKKLEGGSWKDSLLSGGIGAGLGAVGGGALKGIGPTSGVGAKLLGGAAGKTGLGATGAIGSALGQIGTNLVADGPGQGGIPQPQSQVPQPSIGPSVQPPSNPFGGFGGFNLGDSIAAGQANARKRLAFQ